eukprot:TRINITY_DN3318_c1_g1_i1.p1 TRINITY_DN3318_c1_g1~~TRINITY_DN3318_c1_g1_i1.p1  ORF type:complete len:280 (+),score=37.79 TRINITY_DN3318_c1_g1_i1:87-926(+)
MSERKRPVWFDLMSGGAGGGAAKTATAPIQRLVIMQQLNEINENRVISSLKRISSTEGLRGLWRGNLVTILHRVPYSGSSFLLYEKSKQLLLSHSKSDVPTPTDRALSGCVAGAGAAAITYPLDTLRTHLSVGARRSVFSVVRSIFSNSGPSGFYQGMSLSVFQKVPEVALQMTVYETSRDYFSFYVSKQYSVIAASMVSGLSSLVVYPFDLIRRQVQVTKVRSSFSELLARQVRDGGPAALWKGGRAEVARTLPFVLIMWTTIETMRDVADRYELCSA